MTLVEDLLGKGIGFRSLQDGAIDMTTASGELMFNIFSNLYSPSVDISTSAKRELTA